MRTRRLARLAWAPLALLVVGTAGVSTDVEARTPARPAAHGGGKKAKPSKSATEKKLSARSHGSRGRHGRSKKKREPPPQMPTQLELTALDLLTGIAHVEVVGTTRPPATRLFMLTDQSGRRFVPAFAECRPPIGVTLPESPAGPASEDGADDEPTEHAGQPELPATTRWHCTLTIPRLYRRAPLASLTMEWGHLAVAVPAETVARLWGEARAAAPLSTVAQRAGDPQNAPAKSTGRDSPASAPADDPAEDPAEDDAHDRPDPSDR